jgi:hypothetical protein
MRVVRHGVPDGSVDVDDDYQFASPSLGFFASRNRLKQLRLAIQSRCVG